MLRAIGHIFTFIYFLAIFLSSLLPAAYLYVANILGIVAFAIFALLLARGLTYTQNVFKYFLRLTLTAFSVELILILAECYLDINFAMRNVVFTYAAALGFVVGLTLALNSSYMLIMRLETNEGGKLADSRPYNITVQPGSYNLPPWLGLALGIATMILTVYAGWRMNFSYSLYGILLIAAFYLALIDPFEEEQVESDFVNQSVFIKLIRRSIFQHEKHLLRAFLIVLGLNTVYYLIALFLNPQTATTSYFFSLLVFVPAVLLPRASAKNTAKARLLRYALFPLSLIILALLRYLLVLS
ncbi:MAG: hypothetical protein PHR78_06220 [Eubacteriales bacterium]|nr:hypothetical protein [Eubacteriales bacterium]